MVLYFNMPYKDKVKQSAYQRAWVAKRRKEWFDINGPCVLCGSTSNLQVDHKDPNTKISHYIWSWCDARRLPELAKCQVLCRQCHINKSKTECPKGENKFGVKLTEQQILQMKAEYRPGKRGYGYTSLAKKYGINRKTIERIIKGKKWKHLAS